ncbi:hypothetical protein EYF80_009462 [Liparis tanakae]|uniref:Uncharacterized protein n=1 Tax=Liparis tanakae TaxID=230148 RepID=A0A4Z2IS64_9TELE|nr:hypothetical protein EYF80_009462 [Liparis tanakae]
MPKPDPESSGTRWTNESEPRSPSYTPNRQVEVEAQREHSAVSVLQSREEGQSDPTAMPRHLQPWHITALARLGPPLQ